MGPGLQFDVPPSSAGLERVAREIPHARDVPPGFAEWLSPLLERTAQTLRKSADAALELLRQGHSAPASITAVQLPVARCMLDLIGPLAVVKYFPTIQSILDDAQEARERTLERLEGEHIGSILEDVSYALEGLHAVAELFLRAEQVGRLSTTTFQTEFLTRCVVRQARMLLALELLERIAGSSMDDHAFGVPAAAELARTGREHYEDTRAALGFERSDVPTLRGVESSEATEVDAETAALFQKAFARRGAADR